jgi:extradiol dioxygenase
VMGKLVFLHCNPRHHSLAMVGMPGLRGLHHIMLQVNELDDVGMAYDLCDQKSVPIVMTLGRHSNDEMFSFYMRSPSGFEIEYGWGAKTVDDATWSPAFFDVPSVWGHKMVGQEPPGCIEPV